MGRGRLEWEARRNTIVGGKGRCKILDFATIIKICATGITVGWYWADAHIYVHHGIGKARDREER